MTWATKTTVLEKARVLVTINTRYDTKKVNRCIINETETPKQKMSHKTQRRGHPEKLDTGETAHFYVQFLIFMTII